MIFDKEIMNPVTVEQMIDAYNTASQEIEQAYGLLDDALKRLKGAFGEDAHFNTLPRNGHYYIDGAHETVKKDVKRTAWASIINRLNLSKIASTKWIDEMHSNLDNPDNLPELTRAAVFDILMSLNQNKDEIFKELAEEVYDYLRPSSLWGKEYKTNSKYEIGEKVILIWTVDSGYGSAPFKVIYGRTDKLQAIDKVFHLLDGQGVPDGYKSPLIDAINTSPTGAGQTEYFEFKCYQNGNLHLNFRRLELVEALNAMCGGMALRDGPQKKSNRKQAKMF